MNKHKVTYRGIEWTYFTTSREGFDKLVAVAIGTRFTWKHQDFCLDTIS